MLLLRLGLLGEQCSCDSLFGLPLGARAQVGCRGCVKLGLEADIVAADEQLLVAIATVALHYRHELVEVRHWEVLVCHDAHLRSLDLGLIRVDLLLDCALDLRHLVVGVPCLLQRLFELPRPVRAFCAVVMGLALLLLHELMAEQSRRLLLASTHESQRVALDGREHLEVGRATLMWRSAGAISPGRTRGQTVVPRPPEQLSEYVLGRGRPHRLLVEQIGAAYITSNVHVRQDGALTRLERRPVWCLLHLVLQAPRGVLALQDFR